MNNSIETDKVAALRHMAETSDAAKRLFTWLAARARDIAETSVDRAAWKAEASYSEMLAIFRELAAEGLGEFIAGRKGYKTRIRWFYGVRSIGKAGVKQAKALTEVDLEQLEPQEEDPIKIALEESAPATASSIALIIHEYQLRPDLRVALALPADLSARETERLASWVKTLSFE